MSYYFILLILALISLANAYYGPGHRNTPEKEILNAKIKEEFPEILAITSPGGHDNLRETLGDMFEGIPLFQFPYNNLHILHALDGVVVLSTEQRRTEFRRIGRIPNLLAPLLPSPEYEQAGEIDDPSKIYNFMGELAERYVELLKEEGENKEIHVVPIAMVKDVPYKYKSRSIIFFGVLGKRSGSTNNLTGIAGLVAKIK
ncbi:hypothetical protein DdX_15523 [Ditylenchus destructor]|uniref:Uncharacterized protein n=1 Tax=Ditylenchus destructor TaxID=166010 RepID=A0AAD4MSK5_9BILA|nr:hypothetical protein DdX_15523 [Ditylenchus destructor]